LISEGIPPGEGDELETLPVPVPDFWTDNVRVGINVAVTVIAGLTVTEHDPVPGQLMPVPDQPVKVLLASAKAVRVTAEPPV
jgi:hypothetical protein